MRLGLAISVLLHAALLAWALMSIGETRPLKESPAPPVEVSIISAKDLVTEQRKGDPKSKLQEAAPTQPRKETPVAAKEEAPKPPPPAAAPPPPPPPPPPPEPPKVEAPPPPPAPEPDKEALDQKLAELAMLQAAEEKARAENALREKAAAEAKAKAEAEAKAKAEAEAKRKAEEKRRRELAEARRKAAEKRKAEEAAKATADRKRLAALLESAPEQDLIDKDPRKRGGVAPQSEPSKSKEKGALAGSSTGAGNRLSAREEDMLNQIIRTALAECWRKPVVGGAERPPAVTVRWRMRQDGSVDGEPKVVDRVVSQVEQAAAAEAVRAVIACRRFDLPADKYNWWREITWTFDPSRD